ncbi:MAG: hypothetical protein ACHQ53_17220, partial [Polyangiales bacterium]
MSEERLSRHLALIGPCLLIACGGTADAAGASRADMSSGETAGPASVAPAAATSVLQCKAGDRVACFCPDGTQSGSQTCTTSGALTACTGCKTQGSSSTSAAVTAGPTHDGALCAKLKGQVSCTDQSFQSQKLPPSILFLLDRSGSMMCNAPESGQSSADCDQKAQTLFFDKPTKWAITISALEKMLGTLADTGASAGLSFFSTDNVCGV